MSFTRTKKGGKFAYCLQHRVGRMTVSDERVYRCGEWFRPLKICRITKNETGLIVISTHYKQILTLFNNFFFFFSSELELIKIGNVTLGYILVLATNESHIKIPPFLHQAYLCIYKSNGRSSNVPQAREPVCLSVFGWLAYRRFTGTMCPRANENTIHTHQFGTHCAIDKVLSKSSTGEYTHSTAIQNICSTDFNFIKNVLNSCSLKWV